MPYWCIITVRGDKEQVFSAAWVIEKDVKVNIMLFRTLCSIEVQGPCSRYLNLGQSENCIFGIYCLYAFFRRLIRASLGSTWRYNAGFSSCVIEKDVKVNIMMFRTLCSINFQGTCCRNLNFPRFENCVFVIYGQ
jgi:hypothetical protein